MSGRQLTRTLIGLMIAACASTLLATATTIHEAAIAESAALFAQSSASFSTFSSETEAATLSASPSLLLSLSSSSLHSLRLIRRHSHPSDHFTQGLAVWRDPSSPALLQLVEGTGIWGATGLHRYVMEMNDEEKENEGKEPNSSKNGFVLRQSVYLPSSVFGEGVCVVGRKLFQLTYQNQCFFQYEAGVLQEQPGNALPSTTGNTKGKIQDGELQQQHKDGPGVRMVKSSEYRKIAYPTAGISPLLTSTTEESGWREGWGLAFNTQTQHLIVSDGTSRLYEVQPAAPSVVVRHLTVHYIHSSGARKEVDNLNELEYIPHPESTLEHDRGEIFANYFESYCILRIDPTSGLVIGVLKADPKVFYHSGSGSAHPSVEAMNGIAFDPTTQKLIITGKLWKYMYEVEPEVVKQYANRQQQQQQDSSESNDKKASPLGFDLQRECPRLTMSASDMEHWQFVMSRAAQKGQMLRAQLGAANQKQKKGANAGAPASPSRTVPSSATHWAPVPPHSSAGKSVAHKIATILPHAHAPTQDELEQEADADGEDSQHVHRSATPHPDADFLDGSDGGHDQVAAEVSSSSRTRSMDPSAAIDPNDLDPSVAGASFNSARYVVSEFVRMGVEARRERQHATEQEMIDSLLDTGRHGMSGDI